MILEIQFEQHFLVFNMRHVKHIKIIIWHLADTPLNFPYHPKNNSANLSCCSSKHTDRQRDAQTHMLRFYMYDN